MATKARLITAARNIHSANIKTALKRYEQATYEAYQQYKKTVDESQRVRDESINTLEKKA